MPRIRSGKFTADVPSLRAARESLQPVSNDATAHMDAAFAQAVPARPNPGNTNPTSSLLIEYAPIEYVTLPLGIFATAFTQFLVR